MCYCTPSIRTPCCGEKCHDFLGPEAAPCPWHWPWTGKGDSILADVQKMIQQIQIDRKYKPLEMYLSDDAIRALGGDPEDYPTLEGYPGVRVVRGERPMPSIQDWAARAASRIDDEYKQHDELNWPSQDSIAAIIATFAAPILTLLNEARRTHDGKCKVFETATEDAEGILELDGADCTCGVSAWNARINEALR